MVCIIMKPITIISGAQTGTDIAALDAALAAGIPCGGWVPDQRNNEAGPIPAHYPVQPLTGAGYKQRMLKNIEDSDATAIVYFTDLEGGTENTLVHCLRLKKPYKLIDASEVPPERAAIALVKFMRHHLILRLNIAGPRASKQPDAYRYTYEMVTSLVDQGLVGVAPA